HSAVPGGSSSWKPPTRRVPRVTVPAKTAITAATKAYKPSTKSARFGGVLRSDLPSAPTAPLKRLRACDHSRGRSPTVDNAAKIAGVSTPCHVIRPDSISDRRTPSDRVPMSRTVEPGQRRVSLQTRGIRRRQRRVAWCTVVSYVTHLDCPRCGLQHDAHRRQNLCSCGSPLLARYDLAAVGRTVDPAVFAGRRADLWRYRELLPVGDDAQVTTLGEG